jgi:Zn-dependent protease with chaperone function
MRCQSTRRLSWNLYVIDNDTKNAFVLPDGSIFVFAGILSEFDRLGKDEADNKLAVIMGG